MIEDITMMKGAKNSWRLCSSQEMTIRINMTVMLLICKLNAILRFDIVVIDGSAEWHEHNKHRNYVTHMHLSQVPEICLLVILSLL